MAAANINAPIDAHGRTQLHIAVSGGDLDEVNRLIKLGADVNIADNLGYTPLYSALHAQVPEIIKSLLAAPGILVNKAIADGTNPLFGAVELAGEVLDFEPLTLLLAHPRIDVNVTDINGATPLWIALQRGYLYVVDRLLDHPLVDVNVISNDQSIQDLLIAFEPGPDVNEEVDMQSWLAKTIKKMAHIRRQQAVREFILVRHADNNIYTDIAELANDTAGEAVGGAGAAAPHQQLTPSQRAGLAARARFTAAKKPNARKNRKSRKNRKTRK